MCLENDISWVNQDTYIQPRVPSRIYAATVTQLMLSFGQIMIRHSYPPINLVYMVINLLHQKTG
jgi:hypothetical protein